MRELTSHKYVLNNCIKKQKEYRNIINHGTDDITKRKKRPDGLFKRQNFTDFLPSSRKPKQPPF